MQRAYLCYGLRLLANGDIPGLAPCTISAVDVRIWLHKQPVRNQSAERVLWYETPADDHCERPNLVIWRTVSDGLFHFVYKDNVEFFIDTEGSQVWCTWPESATVADVAVYLRGPILGLILRLRKVDCLHASAIAIGQSVVALMGPGGAGKSTTAAAFVKLGYSLFSDDVAALRDDGGLFQVLPGYPQVNLWPDSARMLYGCESNLPRLCPADGINHWWDKRYLTLATGHQFHTNPLPLAAVYVLGDRTSDTEAPYVEPMSARDAFMTLVEHTYVNYALDKSMRAKEFRTLEQLVRTVPVKRVIPHSSPDRLKVLCEVILQDHNEFDSNLRIASAN